MFVYIVELLQNDVEGRNVSMFQKSLTVVRSLNAFSPPYIHYTNDDTGYRDIEKKRQAWQIQTFERKSSTNLPW